jgi:hypothetical protein
MMLGGTVVEIVDKSRYLDSMITVDGGTDEDVDMSIMVRDFIFQYSRLQIFFKNYRVN